MIELTNVTKKYHHKTVLNHISLTINDVSKLYVLVGESGSGKTTLFNILFGLDYDYEGEYMLFGKSARKWTASEWANIRSKDMRMVFQDYKLLEKLTVYENIKLSGDYSEEDVESVLHELDIVELRNHQVSKLSGGQRQRVAIARAVVSRPKVVLLDEPTGNLDSMTADKVMQYLQKLRNNGILVIVITHDTVIAEQADVLLQLENGTVLSSHIPEKKEYIHYQLTSSSHHNTRYAWENLKNNWKETFYISVPVFIIITLFLLTFSAYRAYSFSAIQRFFAGVDNRTILMDTQKLNFATLQEYSEKDIVTAYDGMRIGFSKQDMETISAIPHVQNVELTESETYSNYDKDNNSLRLVYEKKDFPDQIKPYIGIGKDLGSIQFIFNKISVSQPMFSHYNRDLITLVAGHFPQDETNEILVPDVYVSMQYNTEPLEMVLNKKVPFPILNAQHEESTKEYTIVGVYQTHYRNDLQNSYPIYTAYFVENMTDQFLRKDVYEVTIQNLSITPASKKHNHSMIESYEAYEKAVGTGYPSIMIVVDNEQHVASVIESLRQLFPRYQLESQYGFKHGELASVYNRLVTVLLVGSIVIALVAGILIAFINKGYIHGRSKELAILYSLGFTKKEIIQIIVVENSVIFIINFVLASILSYLLNLFYFSKSSYFDLFTQLFEWSNILAIFGLIIVMMIVSVLWGVGGVNRKNLRYYLNQ